MTVGETTALGNAGRQGAPGNSARNTDSTQGPLCFNDSLTYFLEYSSHPRVGSVRGNANTNYPDLIIAGSTHAFVSRFYDSHLQC